MLPRITDVKYIVDYKLELTFSNGVSGIIDLANRIVNRGGVFLSLENQDVFSKVKVDKEIGTLVWPNGVDLDPDVLYSRVKGIPIEALRVQQV